MPSTVPNQPDSIPNAGPNLANPQHSNLHNSLRDGLVAVQSYVLGELGAIKDAAWVTTSRLATGSVTDQKIVSMAATKILGLIQAAQLAPIPTSKLASFIFPTLTSQGDVTAAGYLRAGTSGAEPAVKKQRYGGRLNPDGTKFFPHVLGPGAPSRVGAQGCWYLGDSGEAVSWPGKIEVDGTNIYLTGGAVLGNRYWRLLLEYTQDAPPWQA